MGNLPFGTFFAIGESGQSGQKGEGRYEGRDRWEGSTEEIF
jgi:hypothetical protein